MDKSAPERRPLMQQAAIFWDKAAESYAKSPIQNIEAYNYTLERTRSYLSPTDRILEVGCGTGSTALLLARDVDQIIASDISSNMVQIARRKAHEDNVSNVQFIAADVFGEAIDDGPYDAVLALNLLHLIEDTGAALQRVHGLLKPGGIFISKTVCRPGKEAPLKYRFLRLVVPVMQLLGKAPFVRFMKVHELEDLIQSQGFRILESGDHPAPSRYIVAQKP
jgi:ubiquinone/menaquinone biosynthesis C-methylase UbiE